MSSLKFTEPVSYSSATHRSGKTEGVIGLNLNKLTKSTYGDISPESALILTTKIHYIIAAQH